MVAGDALAFHEGAVSRLAVEEDGPSLEHHDLGVVVGDQQLGLRVESYLCAGVAADANDRLGEDLALTGGQALHLDA
jgi:hypothetical protein